MSSVYVGVPDGPGIGEKIARVGISGGGGDASDLLPDRSEEHTSELQSRSDLVCRLLLEKKKIDKHSAHFSLFLGNRVDPLLPTDQDAHAATSTTDVCLRASRRPGSLLVRCPSSRRRGR